MISLVQALVGLIMSASAHPPLAWETGLSLTDIPAGIDSYGPESFAVGGRGFNDTAEYWQRLPAAAQKDVDRSVWHFSQASAGMFVQFATDATSVGVAYTISTPNLEKLTAWSNFRPTGFSGADIYAYDDEALVWGFVGTTMGGLKYPNATLVVGGIPKPAAGKLRVYRVHLPMYAEISSVAVLANGGETIRPDWGFLAGGKPVVWYGTSITQGGVSPRPGHAFTNRISRGIDREILNFGFCGCGTMQISVAKYLTTLDAAAFVIDCDWNMEAVEIAQRAVPLVKFLRGNGHPTTPVIFAEGTDWPAIWISNAPLGAGVAAKRAALEAAVGNLTKAGDNNVHLVQGHAIYGDDTASTDATFNDVHPTDLGHWRIAQFYNGYLPPVLAGKTPPDIPAGKAPPDIPAAPTIVTADVAASGGAVGTVTATAVGSAPISMVWTDCSALEISGRGFDDTPSVYNRLPTSAKATVRAPVWDLGLNSAGLSVRFESNAANISVNYTLAHTAGVSCGPHFPATGCSGADLYALDASGVTSGTPSVWKFVNSFSELNAGTTQFGMLAQNLPTARFTAYRLYLPTYNNPTAVALGVPVGATLRADPREGFQKPAVVWYGTSILQGGVASRPGNAFTNMISRRLKHEIYNFGFSGNGKMEVGVYEHLAQLNASLIIIDCNWNMDGPTIAANAGPLLAYFRSHGHPTTPVVFAEGTPAGAEWLIPATAASMEAKRSALRGAFEKASPSDPNLHYVNASDLWPKHLHDSPTVAGCHPTDEGGELVAEFYTKMIPIWLAGSN